MLSIISSYLIEAKLLPRSQQKRYKMTLNHAGKTSNGQQVTANFLTCLINAVISISYGVVKGLGNVALEEFAPYLQNTYVYFYL